MAQAVSCRPLTVEARANSHTVWNLWWMSVMGQGFPRVFRFSPIIIIPPTSWAHFWSITDGTFSWQCRRAVK